MQQPVDLVQRRIAKHSLGTRHATWCCSAGSCTSILRVIPSPANQVQSPHFTTCVRGLCHGIAPLFLPADVPGTPLALRHAALCLAKRVYRRGSEAIQASAASAQALPRPEAVSWPHPQAPVCRLSAGPRARTPAAWVPATPPRAHAGTAAPGGHLFPLLPQCQLRLSGPGKLGEPPWGVLTFRERTR